MKDVLAGFNLHFESLQIIGKHRKLTLLALAAGFVYFLLFLLSSYAAIAYLPELLDALVKFAGIDAWLIDGGGFWRTAANYIIALCIWIVKGVFSITIVVTLFLTAFVAGSVLSAPIYDFLSEAIEMVEGLENDLPFSITRLSREITRSVFTELQKALLFLLVPIASLLLSLLPVVGIVASLFMTNFFAALIFGFTFLDYPMARRIWPLGKRLSFCKQNWKSVLGMGLVFFIPVVNFVATPIFVTSGTLLFLRKHEDATLIKTD